MKGEGLAGGPADTSPLHGYRADLDGLRGVAVAAVVAYHAGVPLTAGGYVGVDVFFVLSGFLITGLLIEERDRSGAVRLGRFFARRVRRLLPASALVFVATVVAAVVVLPALDLVDLPGQARTVGLYAGNVSFANDALDYLRAGDASPFQQYWSLAVEEQFYLTWPLLIAVVPRRWRTLTIAAVVVVSFAVCVAWTGARQPWAFFLLPARAWELAAGGLLAIAVRRGLRVPRSVGWVGLAAVAAAVMAFDESTVFPGAVAAVPVLAAVAVIAAPVGALTWSPLRILGRYSYSLYLWHWPVLVLTEWPTAIAVAVSGGLAVATFHVVEHPVRFHPALLVPRRSAALGAALTAVVITSTLMIDRAVEAVPKGLVDASSDRPITYDDGCHLNIVGTDSSKCTYGDGEVALFGDSHAAHWFPAFHRSVRNLTKSSCPAPAIVFELESLGRQYTECDRWREEQMRRIEADPPRVVVIAHYSNYYVDLTGEGAWLFGLHSTVERLSRVTDVVVFRDTPAAEVEIPTCLAENLHEPGRCAPRLEGNVHEREREVVEAAGGRWFDPVPIVCPAECDPLVGDTVVWADQHHLTTRFVREHTATIAAAVG